MDMKWDIRSLSYKYKRELIIFGTAIVLRLIFLAFMYVQLGSEEIVKIIPDIVKYINAADYILYQNTDGVFNLYLVGPGYPVFLAIFRLIFGNAVWPILAVQILLSSVSCVLIYRIGLLLLNNSRISFPAGLIAAVSITSISLSNIVLTESLFFFLFSLSLFLLLKGFDSGGWPDFILSGIFGGLSVLVRSVTQFFPILIIFFAVIIPITRQSITRKQLIAKSIVSALLIILIAGAWGLRNQSRHDIFTVSGTGVIAAKVYLAAAVVHHYNPDTNFLRLKDSLFEPQIINGRPETIRERHLGAQSFVRKVFKEHPGRFVKTYLSNIWDNITVGSYLHHMQLPEFKSTFRYLEKRVSRNNRSPIIPILTLAGFIILLLKNSKPAALVLLLIYLYYAILSGVTFWQTSRIFYPAQVSWAILVSVSLVRAYDSLKTGIKRHKKSRLK